MAQQHTSKQIEMFPEKDPFQESRRHKKKRQEPERSDDDIIKNEEPIALQEQINITNDPDIEKPDNFSSNKNTKQNQLNNNSPNKLQNEYEFAFELKNQNNDICLETIDNYNKPGNETFYKLQEPPKNTNYFEIQNISTDSVINIEHEFSEKTHSKSFKQSKKRITHKHSKSSNSHLDTFYRNKILEILAKWEKNGDYVKILFTTKETSKIITEIGIQGSHGTVKNWRHRGVGPEPTYIHKKPYYTLEAILEWILKEIGEN